MASYCFVSGKEIPEERVQFLKDTGVPEVMWTVVEHSTAVKKKGVYFGTENENFMVVKKVYTDSVRDVFLEEDDETQEIPLESTD